MDNDLNKLTDKQKLEEIDEMKRLLKSDLSKIEVEYVPVNYDIKKKD